MAWLEVIRLRSPAPCARAVLELIHDLLGDSNGQRGVSVSVYVHPQLPGDLAVHLTAETAAPASTPGPLGGVIAERLRRLGLVDHAIWERLT